MYFEEGEQYDENKVKLIYGLYFDGYNSRKIINPIYKKINNINEDENICLIGQCEIKEGDLYYLLIKIVSIIFSKQKIQLSELH